MLIVSVSYADTLVLKSGQQIEGKILERTNSSIKIEFFGTAITYYEEDIDTVNGEKFQGKNVTVNAKEPAPKTETMPVNPTVASVGGSGIKSGDPYINSNKEKSNRLSKFPPGQKKLSTAVTAGVVLVILLLALIMYIYSSLCLQFIAQKTNTEPAWLAWIPVANFFLMCKIAQLSYWWLLALLLSFIPILGMICNMAIVGYIWYKIALARNKPGWIGVIGIVPLVGLVTMGYLAFSD